MKKSMFALIGMILALVFVIVALFGTWYVGSVSYNGVTGDSVMSLTSATTTSGGSSFTISYADARKGNSDTSIFDIFDITLYTTIFALVVAILAVIFLLGYTFNFGKHGMMKNLAMIFSVITFVLTFTDVFYFMIVGGSKISDSINQSMNAYFSALGFDAGSINSGFWSSTSINGFNISSGPGFAWYLMLVAGIIALISSIMLLVFKEKSAVPIQQMPGV